MKIAFGSLAIIWIAAFWYLRNPVLFSSAKTIDNIKVDPRYLEDSVRALANIQPPRQYQNKESMLAAEAFVRAELEKLGYSVFLQDVKAGNDRVYHNMVVRYGDPQAKEVVVIGAHYDVCDDQPGADDNASGVAGVLALAKLLKEQQPKLSTPIELVIYSLEEPPFFPGELMGSAVHAESLRAQGISVKYMVSVEMIGYYSNEMFSQKYFMPFLYLLYPAAGNFISIIGSPNDRPLVRKFKAGMSANSTVPAYSINAPQALPGIGFSDHRHYWRRGWTAIMITDTAFLRNDQYHKVGDTADRLNYKSMAEVVRGIYSAILNSDGDSQKGGRN